MAEPSKAEGWKGIRLFTIGHSTRTLEQLFALLAGFGVAILADIRSSPRSWHNPQFNQQTLAEAATRAGLRYVHLPRLGGHRHGLGQVSPNAAWRNPGFRAYADFMQTEEFERGLEELRALAEAGTVAIMCAEVAYFRCHRALVSDVLEARGAEVFHILGPGKARRHAIAMFAQVREGRVSYPGSPS
jgi:uncharacterized protein (DUF488 family)